MLYGEVGGQNRDEFTGYFVLYLVFTEDQTGRLKKITDCIHLRQYLTLELFPFLSLPLHLQVYKSYCVS